MTLLLAAMAMLFACQEPEKPDLWPDVNEEEKAAGLINLAIGKFYKTAQQPIELYADEYPCLNYSTGVKLTDGDVASSSKSAALGVGWKGVESVDVVVDLGRKRTIESVKLHSIVGQVSMYNFSLPSSVKVCGSADNKSWSTPVALTFDAKTGWATVQTRIADCRYLKLTINAPADANLPMLVDEIEAWGAHKNEMKYVPKRGAYHGAFNNGTSFSGEEGASPCPLDLFEERVGKQISMMLWYQGATGPTRNYAEIMNVRKTYSGKNYNGKYRLFIYGWEPQYTSAELMTGVMDEYYDTYFKEVREVQKGDDDCGPAWFRPGNEMNSNWVKWGNDAPNYVKYWRRMYNIAEQVGLTDYNVFVWSSADISFGKYSMKAYYPGDQYCDWIGTSCYFSQAVSHGYPSYLMNETESMSEEKPVMISEGGFGSDACNNKLWVKEWFELEKTHPRVKAVVWENHNSGTYERRIHTDPEALALYKELVQNDYWLDEVPSEVYDEMVERKTKQNR